MDLSKLGARDLGYVKALFDMGMISEEALKHFVGAHYEQLQNDATDLETAVPAKESDYSNADVIIPR